MRKYILITIALLTAAVSFAQQRQPVTFGQQRSLPQSNWTFGGNIGLSGGNGGFGLFLTPRVGYKLTNDVELAGIVNYTYQSFNDYRSSIFGAGPALNYYVQRNFYLHSSYQHYFVSQKLKSTNERFTMEEDALYIGGGYMQQLGSGGVYMQIGAMYNLLYNKNNSIFSSGFVPNVGIVVGL